MLLQPSLLAILSSLCAFSNTSSAFLLPWGSLSLSRDRTSLPTNPAPKPHVQPKGTTLGGGARKRDKRLRSPPPLPSARGSSIVNKADTASPPPLPRRQDHEEPAKRATNTSDIPDNWFISRAFQGESFFKCVDVHTTNSPGLTNSFIALVRLSSNWEFATYTDPTQYVSSPNIPASVPNLSCIILFKRSSSVSP